MRVGGLWLMRGEGLPFTLYPPPPQRCLRSALQRSEGKSLRACHDLSMLLRQKRSSSADDRQKHIMESLALAKEVGGGREHG